MLSKLKFLGAEKRTGQRKVKKPVFMVLQPTEGTGSYPISREKSISRHSTLQNLGKHVKISSLSQNTPSHSERLPILYSVGVAPSFSEMRESDR